MGRGKLSLPRGYYLLLSRCNGHKRLEPSHIISAIRRLWLAPMHRAPIVPGVHVVTGTLRTSGGIRLERYCASVYDGLRNARLLLFVNWNPWRVRFDVPIAVDDGWMVFNK